jgi:hypothetical protein
VVLSYAQDNSSSWRGTQAQGQLYLKNICSAREGIASCRKCKELRELVYIDAIHLSGPDLRQCYEHSIRATTDGGCRVSQ